MPDPQSIKDSALATAQRLRLLQAELADATAEVRKKTLADTVRDALGRVIPEQRREFLDVLDVHFPSFQDGATPEPAEAAQPELTDPAALAERLAVLGASLSPARKQAIIDRLRDAGFPVSTPAAAPDASFKSLQRALPMPSTDKADPNRVDQIDPARVAELSVILVDFVTKLDQAVWSSWAQINPGGGIRRPGVLQKTMARFIRAEGDRPPIGPDSDLLLKLTASLMVAIQRIGPALFRQYFDPIDPVTIASDVKGSLMSSKDVQCWRKYEERARKMDPESFNVALLASIGRFVNDFFNPVGSQGKSESE